MSRLRRLRFKIYGLLNEKTETRGDDYLLNWETWSTIYGVDYWEPIGEVMTRHAERGLPGWDSASRVRRKLQAEYPALRADKETEERRLKEQEKYLEFSQEG